MMNQEEAKNRSSSSGWMSRFQRSAAPQTILVVDDIRDYTQELAEALRRSGRTVYTAEEGRQAIVLGASVRPDILVTDWLLRDHLHGLDVAKTLSIALPTMRTIVMTGFATADLESDARALGVSGFLEKPFPLETLHENIDRVLQETLQPRNCHGIGFAELTAQGEVVYANPPGKAFLQIAGLNDELEGTVPRELMRTLAEAHTDWIPYQPPGSDALWLVRAREELSEELGVSFLVLSESHTALCRDTFTYRLLGLPDPVSDELVLEGHILVVDDFESIRRLTVDILKAMRCVCLSAQNRPEAIRLFVNDREIRYVLVDYNLEEESAEELISTFQNLRPDVHIIGMSGEDVAARLGKLGVTHFLQKPWGVEELHDLLVSIHDTESHPAETGTNKSR